MYIDERLDCLLSSLEPELEKTVRGTIELCLEKDMGPEVQNKELCAIIPEIMANAPGDVAAPLLTRINIMMYENEKRIAEPMYTETKIRRMNRFLVAIVACLLALSVILYIAAF